DAGRVITEFPMFSFLLGDMHPHVMALPFVLLAVATALMLFRSEEPLDIAFWLRRPLMLVGVAIVIGGLAFINTWDIATLAFVILAAVILGWALVFAFEKAGGSGNLNGAEGLGTQIADRGAAWLTDAFIGAALAASLLALWLELTADDGRSERGGVIFALLLSSTALLLVLGTEFFYVGDVFNSRMNTVFKLYYQAWMMLALAGGFALYYLAS